MGQLMTKHMVSPEQESEKSQSVSKKKVTIIGTYPTLGSDIPQFCYSPFNECETVMGGDYSWVQIPRGRDHWELF